MHTTRIKNLEDLWNSGFFQKTKAMASRLRQIWKEVEKQKGYLILTEDGFACPGFGGAEADLIEIELNSLAGCFA